MLEPNKCLVDGCLRPVPRNRKGWCEAHYGRWRRHGDPLKGRAGTGEAAAFLAEAIAYQGNDCLIWPFNRDQNGYARINSCDGSSIVSRIICTAFYGPPPLSKTDAAHTCGGGKFGCVTGRHLKWKTRKENMADTLIHGTRPVGEQHGMSKLTESKVREILAIGRSKTLGEIAKIYGVTDKNISLILLGKAWAWIPRGEING